MSRQCSRELLALAQAHRREILLLSHGWRAASSKQGLAHCASGLYASQFRWLLAVHRIPCYLHFVEHRDVALFDLVSPDAEEADEMRQRAT